MADTDSSDENSDGGDFTASEDDWMPDENQSSSTENESEEEAPNMGDALVQKKSSVQKGINRSMSLGQKRKPQSLRSKMFNRYKPPPKTVCSTSNQPVSYSLSKVLESSQFKKKKSISSLQTAEESDSSGDDYLVDPKQLDLKSSFFDVNEEKQKAEEPPEFDCNAGIRLSDSEDEEFVDANSKNNEEKKCFSIHEGDIGSSNSAFKHLHEFAMKMESAKQHLKGLKSEATKSEPAVDVSQLLAMGEAEVEIAKSQAKKRKKVADSDSDWEEVQDFSQTPATTVTKEEFQVTVQLHQDRTREKKSQDEIEACLKRKLNRIIKENQVYFHKVSLLCHFAVGIYTNKIINNPTLMAQALKLLPNKNCYPNGRTEIKYFESMVKWFKTAMALKSDKMYSSFRTRPVLPLSLALQILNKAAICKRDFVLIFIVLLRAMGIHCRLVINMVPLPIRPSQSELCRITMKKNDFEPKTKKELKQEQNQNENKSSTHTLSEEVSDNPSTSKLATQLSKEKSASRARKKVKQDDTKQENKKKTDNRDCNVKSKDDTQNNSPKKQECGSVSKTKKRVNKEQNQNGNKSSVQKNKTDKKEKIITSNDAKVKMSTSEKGIKNVKDNLLIILQEAERSSQEKSIRSRARREVKPEDTKEENAKKKSNTNSNVKSQKKLLKQPTSVTESKRHSSTTSPNFSKRSTNSDKGDAVKEVALSRRTTKTKIKQVPLNNVQLEPIPQLDGADDALGKASRKLRARKAKQVEIASDSGEECLHPVPKKKKTLADKTLPQKLGKRDRRVLSTDVEEVVDKQNKKNPMDFWVEVFAEEEDQWVTIDLFSGKIHCITTIRKAATAPIAYVFAWHNDNTIKDVSPRYCLQWHTATRKLRIEQEWLDETLANYISKKKSSRDKKEDRELHRLHLDMPLPTTISDYKNHPLYVLERHLLKFEAIYPPNAVTLGFVRKEPVYARECVHTLHSRDIWLKQARVVKLGEQAYKIVKARPKWDKRTNTVIKDQPLEIFGYWQTKQYEPPTAENGIVPRNAYGNVELFKKCMLPKKTVYLQLPGLNKICKKLQIDCAPAVVGFDFHQGMCHPQIDGYVVCEEFKDTVVDAWYLEQEQAEEKEEAKRLERIYGRWKKFIKFLLIREKLKKKYNFKSVSNDSEEK